MVSVHDQGSYGRLEYREDNRSITGVFPYGAYCQLSDTGPVRRERFESRAFRTTVSDPQAEVHLLVGHDYQKPLACRSAGSLKLEERSDGLHFTATVSYTHLTLPTKA